MVRSILF